MRLAQLDRQIVRFIKYFCAQVGGIGSAFSLMVKQTDRRAANPPKTPNQLSSIFEGDDTEIFEIDRSNLVLQLRALRRTISDGAEEIDMVAVESVFVKSVSRALTRASSRLYLVAGDLDGLLDLIERAHAPKSSGRRDPQRKPRIRRKAPD